jgi:hypothetical protein
MLEGGHEKWTGRWWMICRSGAGRVEAMTLPCGGEEALALFGHKKEAELFLRSLASDGPESGWYIREGRRWEVASVLYGPCADAKRVVLDPMPAMVAEGTATLVSVDRVTFVARLLARDEPRARPDDRKCGNAVR